jgi:hypothetical protein
MPTSKDILDDAQKTLKSTSFAEMAVNDAVKSGVADVAAFGKARAELSSSINSLKTMSKNIEEDIKDLNGGLSELRKNEAVMKAPADSASFKKLVAEFTAKIKKAMELNKKVETQLAACEKIYK